MFEGAYVAIVTPFTESAEQIDVGRFHQLLDWQVNAGIDGIVVSGTTGESPTLSAAEKQQLMDIAVDSVGDEVDVIAGTGTSSTNETIELTKHAQSVGCDGALIVCPPYNKPPSDGLYHHYSSIEQETDLPIILYDNPGRSATNIPADTVIELAQLDGIQAIKEASGDLTHAMKIREQSDLNLLSGSDALTYPLLALGGNGVITVTANIAPDRMTRMVHCYLDGDHERSRQIHEDLFPLMDLLMSETNPIPVKTGLSMMEKVEGVLRSPLSPASASTRNGLKQELQRLDLL